MKAKVTATIVTVATTKSLHSMCNSADNTDVGRGDFWPMLGILHMCGHV